MFKAFMLVINTVIGFYMLYMTIDNLKGDKFNVVEKGMLISLTVVFLSNSVIMFNY